MASDHKTLARSNKSEPPAAAKPVLASPRGPAPRLTPRVWKPARIAPDRAGINPHVFLTAAAIPFLLGG